jgi:hypothetical protein
MDKVVSNDWASVGSSTATGRPCEVITSSFLLAYLSHWLAGFFFSSFTEMLLIVEA